MATYVLIRGLTRDTAQTGSQSMISRGFRVPYALGKKYDGGVKASLTTSLTGANNDLVYTAVYGGTWANSVAVEYLDPSGNNQALALSVKYSKTAPNVVISVSLATNSGGTITSTAADVAALVNADPTASSVVRAANASSNNGTGVVTALTATALSNGTNVGNADTFDVGVSGRATIMVDVDDARTQKRLRRHNDRYISLGLAS